MKRLLLRLALSLIVAGCFPSHLLLVHMINIFRS